MKIRTAVGAALLISAFHITPALANSASELDKTEAQGLYTVEYGETLPPVGYVNFCASNKQECASRSLGEKLSSARMTMTPDRWNMLYQVNTYVNTKIKPVSDQELYGKVEFWTYPTAAGDCEDYVLMKKRQLEKLGVPSQSLQITVVLNELNEGHAVLTVATNEGDFILDNRRSDILLWADTNYTFLKRQSASNPRKWVALLKKPADAGNVAAAKSE